MRLSALRSPRVLAAVGAAAPLILGVGGAVPWTASAQGPTGDYTGRACAVQLQGVKLAVASIPDQCLGDTGPLPAAGGTVTGPTGPVSVPGLITANVLVSQASGANQVSSAQSKVAGVTIVPGTPNPIAGQPPLTPDLVDVTLLSSATAVNCTGIQSPTNTVVGAVTVQGTPVNILNTPNQTVTVGPVSLTLNQQLYDQAANKATGNALVITLNLAGVATGTITLSHAESDLTQCVSAAAAPAVAPSLPRTGSASADAQLAGSQSTQEGMDGRFAIIPAATLVLLATVVVLVRALSRRQADRRLPDR